jgi:hypothetical protein
MSEHTQQFTDRYGRTVVMTGSPGGRVEFVVVDPAPHGGSFTVVFPTKGPHWVTARSRIEAMRPSWYVDPEPPAEPEEDGDEPA